MKMIMIAVKPKWCAKIMNGDKSIEVRSSKALYKATKKLIEEQGYATFLMYCSKGNKKDWHLIEVVDTDTGKQGYEYDYYIGSEGYLDYCLEGKVVAKFTVRKVEEITLKVYPKASVYGFNEYRYETPTLNEFELLTKSCLDVCDIRDYLNIVFGDVAVDSETGYAYHIEDLVIFDKPKELSEFCDYHIIDVNKGKLIPHNIIRKAPQNFVYVESEE